MSLHSNPFVGLRAFESDESLLFFGRQQQTLELLQHLHEHHFVAIVGSSGSGKSSLIRAGLIPSLKAGYLIEERDTWLLAVMKPGQNPLYNMAKAFVCETDKLSGETEVQHLLSAISEEGADALIEYVTPTINNNTNIFLLVDQFEELFRFSSDNQSPENKNEAIEFVNILLDIAQQPHLPIYVVITMRSDFIGDCARFYGLPEAMNKSQYLVPRLNRVQLKNVVTGPIAVYGARIEPVLMNQLLNDAGDNPDQLPVLQHVMMRTWEVWKEKQTEEPIRIEDYKQTGTLKEALSRHAEEAFAELETGRLKRVCELLFKALTDKKQNARGVRRPQTFANLVLLTAASETEVRQVIETFRKNGRTFLMPPANAEIKSTTIIDISHESLMRGWTRLIEWVEEESESEQAYLRLSEAALLYKQKRAGLWRNPELEFALQWKENNKPNEAWAAQINSLFADTMEFLELSRERNEQEALEKEQEQRHRLRRARSVAAVIGFIALISLVLMVYAFRANNTAKKEKGKAQLSEKVAKEQERKANESKKGTEDALRKAEASKQEALKAKDSALLEKERANQFAATTEKALESAKKSEQRANDAKQRADSLKTNADLSAKRARDKESEALKSKNSSDSSASLTQSLNDANKALSELNNNKATSKQLALTAFNLNHKYNGPNQRNIIYQALNKNWIEDINNRNEYNKHQHPVRCIATIPNTNLIITADESGMLDISVVKTDALQHIWSVNKGSDIRYIAVAKDGSYVAVITANEAGYVYKINPDTTLASPALFSFKGIGKKILFYNNNKFIVLSSNSIATYAINTSVTNETFLPFSSVQTIAIGKSGSVYIALPRSIWRYPNLSELIKKNNPESVIPDHFLTSDITSLAVDDKEQYIAAGTYSGSVILKSNMNNEVRLVNLHHSSINSMQFGLVTGNTLQLASAGADHNIELTDVKDQFLNKGEENITLSAHTKWIYDLAYNNNNTFLFSCGEDNKVILWKPTMTDLNKSLLNHQ